MIYNHIRTKIVSKSQHLLTHSLADFGFGNPALPSSVNNAEDAINWILSVLYPNTKPSVPTPADLPTGVDTPNPGDLPPSINDYRLVQDDGTGKTAGYIYAKYDTDPAPTWHKTHSFDWGVNNVLQGLLNQTQPLYVKKNGSTDYDTATGLPITGIFAGQSIYGGEASNQNLTLNATNFDNTGYVQFNDNTRPTYDNQFVLGTPTERFSDFQSVKATIGTTTVDAGTITDTSGLVDFVSTSIQTLGNITANNITGVNSLVGGIYTIGPSQITSSSGAIDFGANTVSSGAITSSGNITGLNATFTGATISDITIGAGSITSASPTIDFGVNGLSTTGAISVGDITGLVTNVSSITATTGNIGSVAISGSDISSTSPLTLTSTSVSTSGDLLVGGLSSLNNVSISTGSSISFANGFSIDETGIYNAGTNVLIDSPIVPNVDANISLGSTTGRYLDLFLSNSITNGTESVLFQDLTAIGSASYRDVTRTAPAQNGDVLVYDSANSKWLAQPQSSIIPTIPFGFGSFTVDFTSNTNTVTAVTVSSVFPDAKKVIWQLYDQFGNEVVLAKMVCSTTQVTITRDIVGTPSTNIYTLKGVGVI